MNPNEPHFEAVETKREQIERDLRPFSDDDLLMELRRRNVLGRVDYHTITPGRYVEDGYPLMSQFRETYMGLAHELHKAYGDTITMPSGKIETGRFDTFGWCDDLLDRKLTLTLNYVKLPKAK